MDSPCDWFTAVECLHSTPLTKDEWRRQTQDDFVMLEPWLVPTGEFARHLRRGTGLGATHHVRILANEAVIIDKRMMLAAERVPLDSVSLWHIDPRRLCDSIRSALGMATLSSSTSLPGTHCVGMVRGDGGEAVAAFLILTEIANAELVAIGQLLSAATDPILIMTPTGASWSDALVRDAKQRGCTLCPLTAMLESREERLIATSRWRQVADEALARARVREVTTPPNQSEYRLVQHGKVWSMTFAGQTFPLKDSVGLVYLREIVRHPHKARSFMDCMPRLGDKKARAGIAEAERRDPNFELKALKDARSGLTNDIENARRLGDMAAMDKAAGQLAQIKQQIRADTRLARTRQQQTAEHRSACNAFKQAMKRTIDEISEANSDAGRHFQDHLTVMQTVTYTPPPGVTWEF